MPDLRGPDLIRTLSLEFDEKAKRVRLSGVLATEHMHKPLVESLLYQMFEAGRDGTLAREYRIVSEGKPGA